VRAFRSGMLLLAVVALATRLPAGAQSSPSPSADQKETPAAQSPVSPAPQVPVAEVPIVLPPGSLSEPNSAESTAAPPSVSEQTPRPRKKVGLDFWSPERELEMGKQLDGQMLQQVQLLSDPEITDYLEDVTARIARNSEIEVPVVLRVVESSVPDSFSLPGGFLYITVGMVQETRTEAELAAIISHEVAHIARRHATRQMTKQQMFGILSLPLMLVGGPIAFAAAEGVSLAYPFTMLKFSRNSESEADIVGLGYMVATGYDPTAAISLFERVASQDNARMPGLRRLVSTHPLTKDRLAAISKAIAKLPPREESVVSTSQYDEVVGRLSRMGYHHNPGSPALIRRTKDGSARP